MRIAGLQKLTLLDFPGRCAATVFTPGCNLRCLFCHNASLVDQSSIEQTIKQFGLIPEEDVLGFLKSRFGRLTGVAVTGGEPLMQQDLADFLRKVREIGYGVKLDTNGTNPQKLKELLDDGLVDYAAMDFKNCRSSYGKTAGLPESTAMSFYEKTLESARAIIDSGIGFEFRTTITAQLHTVEDVRSMAKEIACLAESLACAPEDVRYFLQNFVDSGDILSSGYSAHSKETLELMLKTAKEYLPNTQLRGI